MERQHLAQQVCICQPVQATREEIQRFHTKDYVAQVIAQSISGEGYLDLGDTPVYPGVYGAAATVVGTVLDAVSKIMAGQCRRAFVPIAGLHHARRDGAAGFCVFNDCGVAIETLRLHYGLTRIAYVDIDAHHGDGVYYGFVDQPGVIIADIHEDGRYLYPGTGSADEVGEGVAVGTKLNLPLEPGAGQAEFLQVWPQVEAFLVAHAPEFIILQCGADSVQGDPLTHMCFPAECHGYAAERLCVLAEQCCQGRLLALGGGGYERINIACAWTQVVEAMIDAPQS